MVNKEFVDIPLADFDRLNQVETQIARYEAEDLIRTAGDVAGAARVLQAAAARAAERRAAALAAKPAPPPAAPAPPQPEPYRPANLGEAMVLRRRAEIDAKRATGPATHVPGSDLTRPFGLSPRK